MELSESEQAFLVQLAATVDMNLARLSQAEQGVKVSTKMFREAWRLILLSKGLDPDLYTATWDGAQVVIKPIGEAA